jgi:hypothetical protein
MTEQPPRVAWLEEGRRRHRWWRDEIIWAVLFALAFGLLVGLAAGKVVYGG